MSYVLDVNALRFVRLSNEQFMWKLDIGSNWNYLRIAMLARFPWPNPPTDDFYGTLLMGLCSGYSGVGDSTTTGFYGAEFPGRQVSYTMWDVYQGMAASHAKAYKKEATTVTRSSTFTSDYYALPNYYYGNPEDRVLFLAVDIDKTNDQAHAVGRTTTPGNITHSLDQLKSASENLSVGLTDCSRSSAMVLSLPSATLDTVNISWNKSSPKLDIRAIDVYRFS